MAPFITDNGLWCSKSGEDVVLLEELKHYLGIISWGYNSFNLLAHIIHSEKDVQLSKGWWKWPYKVDSPNINDLDFYDVV